MGQHNHGRAIRSVLSVLFVTFASATVCASSLSAAPLISVADGTKLGLLEVRAEDAPLRDVLTAIAEKVHVAILIGEAADGKIVQNVSLKDVDFDVAFRTIARACGCGIVRQNNTWQLVASDHIERRMLDCSYKRVDFAVADLDHLFVQNDASAQVFRGGITLLRGHFDAQLNALIGAGRARVINEPHAGVASGETANLLCASEGEVTAPDGTVLPGLEYAGGMSTLWLTPSVSDDGSTDLRLILQTSWVYKPKGGSVTMAKQPTPWEHVSSPNVLTTTIDLPSTNLGPDSRRLLIRGWGCAPNEDERRETALIVSVLPLDD